MPSLCMDQPKVLTSYELSRQPACPLTFSLFSKSFFVETRKRQAIEFGSEKCHQQSSKKRRVGAKKTVQFADKCEHDGSRVFISTHVRSVSDDDCKKSWIQGHEYKVIRKENFRTLMELKKANGRYADVDATKFCFRGLENLAAVYVFESFHNQAKWGPQRVIEFQKMGVNDPESLGKIAESLSRTDQIKAWKMALVDAIL